MSSLKQDKPRPTVTDQSALPGISDPSLQTDNRVNYEDMDAQTNVACATHAYGVKDEDSLEMWAEITAYLKTDALPECCHDPAKQKSFI